MRTLLTLLFGSLLLFAFGCSSDSGNPTDPTGSSNPADPANSLVGEWNLNTMKIENVTEDPLNHSNVTVRLILNADGTGLDYEENFGTPHSQSPFAFTWTATETEITVNHEGPVLITYSITNNQLTWIWLEDSDNKIHTYIFDKQ